MPGAEDDGHLLAVGRLQCGQEVAHALHPGLEFCMILAAGEDFLHHRGVGDVPCGAFGEFLPGPSAALDGGHGIARMPAEGDDAAALVVGNDFLGHTVEGHAVEVLAVAHLDAAQVEAHDGGIVATGVLHVAGVAVVLPRQAIHRVILMAIHNAFLPERVKPVQQLLGHGLLSLGLGGGSLLLPAASHQRQHCQAEGENS